MGYYSVTRYPCAKCGVLLVSTPDEFGTIRLGDWPLRSCHTTHEPPECETWRDPQTRHDCMTLETWEGLHPPL